MRFKSSERILNHFFELGSARRGVAVDDQLVPQCHPNAGFQIRVRRTKAIKPFVRVRKSGNDRGNAIGQGAVDVEENGIKRTSTPSLRH